MKRHEPVQINETELHAVTGGGGNDYYDPIQCFLPKPDSRCRIRNGGLRCLHMRIETMMAGASEKYRYICAKGCFDYLSDCKLHENNFPTTPP
ncbi:MAG: hypothetical protein FWG72_03715 [Oscillospiraceae bacterium]|nr:hypothetical protein [Oscillospiraceae bacterium]